MEIWKKALKLGILLTIFSINSYANPQEVVKPKINSIGFWSGKWHIRYDELKNGTNLLKEELFVDGNSDRIITIGTKEKRGFPLHGTYSADSCHKAYVVVYDKSHNVVTKSDTFEFGDTSKCDVSELDDTVSPIITLIGKNPQLVTKGQAYKELGAIALDNRDGELTNNIIIDSTAVDTSTLDEYIVKYNVADASGNNAITVTRTVKVVSEDFAGELEIHSMKFYRGKWYIKYQDLRKVKGLKKEILFVDGVAVRNLTGGYNRPFDRGFAFIGAYAQDACHEAYIVAYDNDDNNLSQSDVFEFGDVSKCGGPVDPTPTNCDMSTAITREELMARIDMGEDVTQVNTCAIIDMSNLFSSRDTIGADFYVKSFNQDISKWDVSNVTDMSHMFLGAKAFNQPLGDWDVSSVTDMYHMFLKTQVFNLSLSNWDLSSVNDTKHIFYGVFKVDAGVDKIVILNNTVKLIGTVRNNDTWMVSTTWKEGSTILSNDASFIYKPTTVGEHNLTLFVEDTDGVVLSDSVIITVTNVMESNFKLKKTGQAISYYSKDDGAYQKGVALSYTRDDVNEIVTDNVTKLQWQDNSEAKTVSKNWEDANTYCSELTLGGYNDWLLPTLTELNSIIDYGKSNPSIDTSKFKNVSNYYWSATRTASTGVYASLDVWLIGFNGGLAYYNNSEGLSLNVRCVRERMTQPASNFTKENGVVKDNVTQLEWQDDYSDNEGNIKQANWKNSSDYCESLSLVGGGWRLPNILELVSLVDNSTENPAIDSIFKFTGYSSQLYQPYNYWSASTSSENSNIAWSVQIYLGDTSPEMKRFTHAVRCVR